MVLPSWPGGARIDRAEGITVSLWRGHSDTVLPACARAGVGLLMVRESATHARRRIGWVRLLVFQVINMLRSEQGLPKLRVVGMLRRALRPRSCNGSDQKQKVVERAGGESREASGKATMALHKIFAVVGVVGVEPAAMAEEPRACDAASPKSRKACCLRPQSLLHWFQSKKIDI